MICPTSELITCTRTYIILKQFDYEYAYAKEASVTVWEAAVTVWRFLPLHLNCVLIICHWWLLLLLLLLLHSLHYAVVTLIWTALLGTAVLSNTNAKQLSIAITVDVFHAPCVPHPVPCLQQRIIPRLTSNHIRSWHLAMHRVPYWHLTMCKSYNHLLDTMLTTNHVPSRHERPPSRVFFFCSWYCLSTG